MRGCDEHGAIHRKGGAAPQTSDSLLFGHSGYGVQNAFVVAALGQREAAVGLHSDHGHVGRVSDDGPDPAGDQSSSYLAYERHVAGSWVSPFLLKNVVETHASSGVQRLAKDGGRDAGEESDHPFLLHDPDSDGDRTHARGPSHVDSRGSGACLESERWTESLNGGIGNLRLTLELHPDLDEVERVGGTPSDDRSNTPFNKALETHL